jgi:hypothetical protein
LKLGAAEDERYEAWQLTPSEKVNQDRQEQEIAMKSLLFVRIPVPGIPYPVDSLVERECDLMKTDGSRCPIVVVAPPGQQGDVK